MKRKSCWDAIVLARLQLRCRGRVVGARGHHNLAARRGYWLAPVHPLPPPQLARMPLCNAAGGADSWCLECDGVNDGPRSDGVTWPRKVVLQCSVLTPEAPQWPI